MVSVSCWLVLLNPVGTLDLSVRCIKGYCIVALTGTDALPLDTLVRPSVQNSVTAVGR